MIVLSSLKCDGTLPRNAKGISLHKGATPVDAELKRTAKQVIEKIYQLRDSL
jgi:hypothetical protein